MKKIVCLLLVLAACLAALTACHNPVDDYVPQGYKRISDTSADYRFFVPESWTADLSTGVTTAYVSSTDRSNVSFLGFEVSKAVITGTYVTGAAEESAAPAETAAGTTAETAAPAESGVTEVPEITTVDEYWAYYEENFVKTFPDMTYSVKGENRLLSGVAAKTYVYSATVTGIPCRFLQVVALHQGTAYLFTYTATEEKYESHLEEVEGILGNLQLKNAK